MFERMTDRARRVVVLAQEEAHMMQHHYIGTEHVLLGLIHEGEGVAAKVLDELGVSLSATRADVEEIIGRGASLGPAHVPFTPRSKKVLEFALREALQLGHNYIGTEHILLGLVREGEGVAVQVLVGMGVQLAAIRPAVLGLLSGYKKPVPVATTVLIPRQVSLDFLDWIASFEQHIGPLSPAHPAKRMQYSIATMVAESE